MVNRAISVAWTGASGAGYGLKLVQVLLQQQVDVHLMVSDAARVVLATEHGLELPASSSKLQEKLLEYWNLSESEHLHVWGKQNWFSPAASGSSAPKQMVVCPCSTGSLAAIATGLSDSLIERAADVVLKERGQLILVTRETPLSQIHIENMLKLTQMGAVVMPASPGFYQQPQSIDDLINFMVARILDHLNISQSLMQPWGYETNNKS